MVVESKKDQTLRDAVNQADLATPDGMPLCKVMQFKQGIQQDRVAGMDMFPILLDEAAQKGVGVFFYGDTPKTLAKLTAKVREEFPDIRIAGSYSPPFRNLSQEEETDIIEIINQSGTGLLFVALGCPKQEKWMARHKGLIRASMIGVGNAFRTYLGMEKRAPVWMQKMALEWLYRFAQNPGRLWKRYVFTNAAFLMLLLRNSSHVQPQSFSAE